VILIFLVLCVFSTAACHAFESRLLDIHNQIFEESKKIKDLFRTTKDVILISTMWDSCIITVNQLEAYFFMVSIFNTIKERQLEEKPVGYLMDWLNKIKQTNELNIKSLDDMGQALEPSTELHLAVLKVYYKKLNSEINEELEKLSTLKKSLESR